MAPCTRRTFPPKLTGDMLFDAVNAKSSCASGFDGSAWNDFRAWPVGRFDGSAAILVLVEESWGFGLFICLMPTFVMIFPKNGGDATPIGQLPWRVSAILYKLWALSNSAMFKTGLFLGFQNLCSVLGGALVLLTPGAPLRWMSRSV